MKKVLSWLVGLVVSVLVLFSAWVYLSTYHPPEVEQEKVHSPEGLPVLQAGQTVKLLSWNVQFMAGNQNNHFFYDDGLDPWPSAQTVKDITQRVAAYISEQDPDFVLLQEVDDVAKRTHFQDQTQSLRKLLPQYKAYTETFYWKADYVPHPAIKGRVGMKLVVLSKYALKNATRFALPAITTDDVLRRQFNLKRAMQQVHVPLQDGQELVLINTHLSAFAQGSDTMQRQIAKVMGRLETMSSGERWILAGDFNLLPNDAALASYTELRSHYNDQGTELYPLINQYPSIPSLKDIEANPELWFTYMSSLDPLRRPDRTIDYIFYSPRLEKQQGKVLRGDAMALSDHLPLVIAFTL